MVACHVAIPSAPSRQEAGQCATKHDPFLMGNFSLFGYVGRNSRRCSFHRQSHAMLMALRVVLEATSKVYGLDSDKFQQAGDLMAVQEVANLLADLDTE